MGTNGGAGAEGGSGPQPPGGGYMLNRLGLVDTCEHIRTHECSRVQLKLQKYQSMKSSYFKPTALCVYLCAELYCMCNLIPVGTYFTLSLYHDKKTESNSFPVISCNPNHQTFVFRQT